MSVYSASFTWRAIQELFDSRKEVLAAVVNDESDVALNEYLASMVPGDTPEEIQASLKVLEELAYKVAQTLDNDFELLREQVKEAPKEIQSVFSPADCKLIIHAFENGKTPEVHKAELVIGIYLVLISGEQNLRDFDVLDLLIDLETPAAEEYQRQVDAANRAS